MLPLLGISPKLIFQALLQQYASPDGLPDFAAYGGISVAVRHTHRNLKSCCAH